MRETATVWDQYRRTLVPMQLTILVFCALASFALHVPPAGILVLLVVMEICSVIGAAWGLRMRRRLTPRSRFS